MPLSQPFTRISERIPTNRLSLQWVGTLTATASVVVTVVDNTNPTVTAVSSSAIPREIVSALAQPWVMPVQCINAMVAIAAGMLPTNIKPAMR